MYKTAEKILLGSTLYIDIILQLYIILDILASKSISKTNF